MVLFDITAYQSLPWLVCTALGAPWCV